MKMRMGEEIAYPSDLAPLAPLPRKEVVQLYRRPGPVLAIIANRLQRIARTGPGLRLLERRKSCY